MKNEEKKNEVPSNPEIKEQYKKRYQKIQNFVKKQKNRYQKCQEKKVVIRLKISPTSKTRPLLYWHNMSSKPVSEKCQILQT